ncbi:MAG: hypothetical protein Kow0013_10480 [Pararhodobacter sp.]
MRQGLVLCLLGLFALLAAPGAQAMVPYAHAPMAHDAPCPGCPDRPAHPHQQTDGCCPAAPCLGAALALDNQAQSLETATARHRAPRTADFVRLPDPAPPRRPPKA